jgi:hypothetical protein
MGFASTTPQGKWFIDVFRPALAAFTNALADWRDEPMRTTTITAVMLETEKKFIPIYRELYNGWLRSNPLVTDEDLVFMGLPKHMSNERRPAPIPTTWPAAFPNTATQRRIKIDFDDSSGPRKKAKPAGTHGAEIRWAIFDGPQEVTLEELIHSSFDTRTPFFLDFKEEERGKVFYFTMRWENTRGEKGPFSPIQEAIIP